MHAGREDILPPFFVPTWADRFPRGKLISRGEGDTWAQGDRAAVPGACDFSLLGEQLDQASYLFDGLDGSDYDDYADE